MSRISQNSYLSLFPVLPDLEKMKDPAASRLVKNQCWWGGSSQAWLKRPRTKYLRMSADAIFY